MFRERLQGSKPNGLMRSLYHWKLLKRRCLKWACITHLDIWNISYGQKKDRKSNWQFDSQPLKVRNRPNLPASNLISIRGLHAKLWAPKVTRVPTLAMSGFPLGNSRTKKTIWMSASWKGAKYIIKGKVLASPKFGPWWVLWVQVARGSS